MGRKDPRIDAYIEKAQPFAKPILKHLRKLIHSACPQVEENWKWSFPHFDYKGPMCSMASFKNHCSFGFWKTSLMKDPDKIFDENREGMGSFGKITSLKDLPTDKIITSYLKEAMKLNEEGVKVSGVKKPKPPVKVPDYFLEALKTNKTSYKTFLEFPPSHKREYVEWITEAKTEATREKRMIQAVEWIAEGKQRNWKYMK